MKTEKTIRKQPAAPQHFTSAVNFNRPWNKSHMTFGDIIVDWHGREVARVTKLQITDEERQAIRQMIVRSVNAFDAAMRVVNLMALMKHTCEKRAGGRTATVHECARCLAEVAQARAEDR